MFFYYHYNNLSIYFYPFYKQLAVQSEINIKKHNYF